MILLKRSDSQPPKLQGKWPESPEAFRTGASVDPSQTMTATRAALIRRLILAVALFQFQIVSGLPHSAAAIQDQRLSISSNEALAQLTLRHLATAEATFQSTVGKGKDFGSLKELAAASLIDANLVRGVKGGYRFMLSVTRSSKVAPSSFEIIARPLRYGATGVRSFHLDWRFIMREAYARNSTKAQMQAMVHECGSIECSEAAAVLTMRQIATAQSVYQSTFGRGRTFATLRQLRDQDLVDPALDNGIRNGYLFRVRADPGSPTEAASFEVRAIPLEYGVTGKLSFYIDETFLLRGGDKGGEEAHSNDRECPCR